MENESHQKHCPKCGKENPNDVRLCQSCGGALTESAGITEGVEVRLSKAAIASCVLAPFSLACFVPGVIAILDPRTLNPDSDLVTFAASVSILAIGITLILGLVGLTSIGLNAGRVSGAGFATIGTIVPIVQLIVIFVIPTLPGFRNTMPPGIVCGFNLSTLGKAILIYAGDYDEKWPIAGGANSVWTARIPDWKANNPIDAFDLQADKSGGRASISSSLYLLVKYCDVTPKTFVCKGDYGTTPFKPAKYGVNDELRMDLWDFGPNPPKHCSYSYHQPYGPYPLTTSCEPGLAVAADRNPWIDSPFQKARDFQAFDPNGGTEQIRAGNTCVHKEDGQNVLFLDGHVSFKRNSICGVNDDNIYTCCDGEDIRRGTPPGLGSQPADKSDSLLVNDPAIP